ncbi:endonuclease III [Candidatus Woesearchaeota archaeon]|nr:endonuclease III [Candidatus Woesearchaeota archaeon]
MDLKTLKKVFLNLQTFTSDLPVPLVELTMIQTNDPFKVLVATILSARTKDSLTITILPKLFEKVKTIDDLKKIKQEQLEKLIYPIGFYKNKAKFLKQLPKALDEKFNGVIPQIVEEVVLLPGVGRKTANLVVSVGFDKPAICVDTHVHKIMNRFGFLETKNPLETEMELRKKLPQNMWQETNRIIVAFGQYQCVPVSPKCSSCPVKKYCERKGVMKSR